MEALYFFTGIIVLLAVVAYAVHCVNRTSYLHDPFRMPSRKSKAAFQSAAPRELTRSASEMNSYVEWYTHRHTARRSKVRPADPTGTPYEVGNRRKKDNKEPEVFVGMAVLHEPPEKSVQRKEKNVDRWFRQEAANG